MSLLMLIKFVEETYIDSNIYQTSLINVMLANHCVIIENIFFDVENQCTIFDLQIKIAVEEIYLH